MICLRIGRLIFEPIIVFPIMIVLCALMLITIVLNKRHIINRILIIILFFIISQRPMIIDVKDDVFNWNFDIIFVIDNTVSMNANDVNELTRFAAVKKDVGEIVSDFAGASFAVINYSNVALVKQPFTRTTSKILDVVNKLKTIDPNYANGSSLNLPYEYLKMLLESSKSKEGRKTIVFFMGDGELDSNDVSYNDFDKYSDLKDLIDSGAVLGYGTTEGSKIKIVDSVNLEKLVDNDGFLINADTNSPYISKLDENNLKILAERLGVNYYHMTDYSILKKDIVNLKKETMDNKEEKVEKKIDIYYYFSFALIILLLLELLYYRRND